MRSPVSRRDFLLGSASLLLTAGYASAMTIEENALRERLYLAACEVRSEHEAMIEKIMAELEAGKTVTPEAHEANLAKVKAQRCPTCGCALGSPDPYSGRF